jgi:hypothetical protein
MSSTVTRFEPRLAPCGKQAGGELLATEDQQGLITRDLRFSCGCQTHHEEFHDGSVHNQVVHHRGRVLVDEELRGE